MRLRAGQPRPEWFRRVDDLVLAYLALLEHLDLGEVVVVGNSIGGWIAAELALRCSPRIRSIVLLNACGIDAAPDQPAIVNPMTLPPADRIVTPGYGRRFADSIPTSRFELIAEAGHFPQIEKLGEVVASIGRFSGPDGTS